MSGTITVPTTLNGTFVYATAAGTFTSYGTGYTLVDFVIMVDGTPTTSLIASPQDYHNSYTQSTQNVYSQFGWTVNGLFTNLSPGNHTVAVYAANCGFTPIAIGAQSGATLTSMVLNK
jgi:hypothetical protein